MAAEVEWKCGKRVACKGCPHLGTVDLGGGICKRVCMIDEEEPMKRIAENIMYLWCNELREGMLDMVKIGDTVMLLSEGSETTINIWLKYLMDNEHLQEDDILEFIDIMQIEHDPDDCDPCDDTDIYGAMRIDSDVINRIRLKFNLDEESDWRIA